MSATGGWHDDPAKDYRRRYELPDQFVWDEAAWPRIDFDGYTEVALNLLPPPPARVLDVGCGPGAGAARLLEHGYDVTGVDFSDRAVGFAKLMVPAGTFVEADIRGLGQIEGLGAPFDAVWCIEVLEHVPPEDRDAMLSGIRDMLRPGGSLVLTTPNPRMHGNPWDYRRADLSELRGLLAGAGLQVVDVRFQHRITPFFSRGVWRLLSNGVYDLRAVRHAMRRWFLKRWNVVRDERRAGRYVIRADRP